MYEKVQRQSSELCYPFVIKLWGKDLVFSHKGDVPQVKKDEKHKLKTFFQAGETDSEYAFC
ncbi:MAG: hypothetical protein GU362_03525 [Thaumarchaeota archaeon]|nr:hypothetical protein [Nitrososphaerota archaeon]